MQWRRSPRLSAPNITIARVCFVYYYSIGRTNVSVLSCLGAFLNSLVDEMEGKEREREEN